MRKKSIRVILLSIMLLFVNCSDSTGSNGDNATEGELTVTGEYQTSFNYIWAIYDERVGEYTGVLATQSMNLFEDEFGFGLYSDGLAVFTKSTGDHEWLGYTGMDLDASFDVSDTCKPRLIVNNIVLYYDSSYSGLGFWEFDPETLDSSKSVTINGDMSTDYGKLGLCD